MKGVILITPENVQSLNNECEIASEKVEVLETNDSYFLSAADVAKLMNCSPSRAYKMIKTLNDELSKEGYLFVAGRISSKYFFERTNCYVA